MAVESPGGPDPGMSIRNVRSDPSEDQEGKCLPPARMKTLPSYSIFPTGVHLTLGVRGRAFRSKELFSFT